MLSKPLLRTIPGFRSGTWWKSLTAIAAYFFIIIFLLVSIIPSSPSLSLETLSPTNKNHTTISGKTNVKAEVYLLQDNNKIQSIKADSSGKFHFALNDLKEGSFTYTVKTCNSDKRKYCTTENILIVIDQTPPKMPMIALPHELPDEDGIEVIITGKAEPETKINLLYGNLELPEITVDSNGEFSFTTKLIAGEKQITLQSIDAAGNISEKSTETINFNPTKVRATVYRVVDGDTIKIDGGKKRVRYIGIDTPETVHPSKPVECYGKQASNKNKKLVEGKEILLEKDVSETDQYGRLLRYVWIDDILVNELLVREGYAQSSTYPPDVKYQNKFIEAQRLAMAEKKGLWGNFCDDWNKPVTTTQPAPSTTVVPLPSTTTTQPTPTTTYSPPTPTTNGSYTCNCSKTCPQMSSCEEAYYQLDTCGCSRRDGDSDGVPCESICPGG